MECNAGKLQWLGNQSECVACDDSTLHCSSDADRANIRVKYGFYLPSGAWETPTLSPRPVPCPYEPTCQGGDQPGSLCVNGSSGRLCGVCAQHFFRDRHSCAPCPETFASADTTLIISILAVIAVFLLLFSYLHSVGKTALAAAVIADKHTTVATAMEPLPRRYQPFVSFADWPADTPLFVSHASELAIGGRVPNMPPPPLPLSLSPLLPPPEPASHTTPTPRTRPWPWHHAVRRCAAGPTRMANRVLPASWRRQLGTLIKIAIGYSQMLSVFARLQSVHWPAQFTQFIHSIDISVVIGTDSSPTLPELLTASA